MLNIPQNYKNKLKNLNISNKSYKKLSIPQRNIHFTYLQKINI